jgi:hypothetical protein
MRFLNEKNERVLDVGAYDSMAILTILSAGGTVTCTNGVEYVANTEKRATIKDFGTRSRSDKTLVFYVKEDR